MPILFELYLALIRIFMLLSGSLLTFLLGEKLYLFINGLLAEWSAPCLEVISFLVTIVPVAALFYGIHIQKAFWKREDSYNKKIFLFAFGLGLILAFIPVGHMAELPGSAACSTPQHLMGKFVYAVATGALTAFLAFVGMDIGVMLKHTSHKVKRRHHVSTVQSSSVKKSVKKVTKKSTKKK